jgi:polysaccharide deacetylase family protein (PEP-CTERM system associated)
VTNPPDILTVDVEEWFHGHNYLHQVPPAQWNAQTSRVAANTERCLELLACHGVRATFFVLGWTAERQPDLVRRIAAAGHEVACHSYAHPMVFQLDQEEFLADLDRALTALAAAGVTDVGGYRAPSFTLTPPVHSYLELLRQRGFRYDCSLFPIGHPRYGQMRSPRRPFLLDGPAGAPPLVIVPMTSVRLAGANFPFSGGGYLRLLPMAAYRALRSVALRQGSPVIVYVHPWEMDSYRPNLGLGRLARLRAQGGQLSMPGKLEAILSQGSFQTMGEYVAGLIAAGSLPRRSLPLV